MPTLFHYTDQQGLSGILGSATLRPSLAARSPRDVRHGDGQYLTDIRPGTMNLAQISRALIGHPFQGRRFTHFLEIDVLNLIVVNPRPNVFVIPNDRELDLTNRIIRSGVN
jgi:hypothetical protein